MVNVRYSRYGAWMLWVMICTDSFFEGHLYSFVLKRSPNQNDGPGAQMIDLIFEGQPVKRRPFPSGTRSLGFHLYIYIYMGVSKNNGTVSPNHPF